MPKMLEPPSTKRDIDRRGLWLAFFIFSHTVASGLATWWCGPDTGILVLAVGTLIECFASLYLALAPTNQA